MGSHAANLFHRRPAISDSHKYETFCADSGEFDRQFTACLNEQAGDRRRAKHGNDCQGSSDDKR